VLSSDHDEGNIKKSRKNQKKRKAKHDDLDEADDSKAKKKPRPNYFISIQMTNKQVRLGIFVI